MVAKFEAQELEINRLKDRVKLLEDREGMAIERYRDDAPITGRNLDEGEAAAKRGEGSGTPTEPHHTPFPEAQHTSYTTHSSPTLPPVTNAPIPTVTPSDTPTLR
uniref:Uncharacterized protein n=1 Tax=Tanacetum cinerariifolium TaxID=118510 RepID=A0A699U1Q9_TANCI|nr:hypothetical protein [Tanacetum cinerariifolium]